MQDFSQTKIADGTKRDIKDEDHGLYPLICYFCHVRSTGLLVWMRALFRGEGGGGVSIVTLELESWVRRLCTFKVLSLK